MENWDKVSKYSEIAANSQGSAMEKYEVYLDSIQAHINEFKAAWEDFAYRETVTTAINGVLDAGTSLLGVLDRLGPAFDLIFAAVKALADLVNGLATGFNMAFDAVSDFLAPILGYDNRTNSEISDQNSLYEQQIKYLESKQTLTEQEIANLEELNRLLKENNDELAKREEAANRPDLQGYYLTTAGYQYRQMQGEKYADYMAGNTTATDLEAFGGMAQTAEIFKTMVEQGRELEGLDLSYLSKDLQENAAACIAFAQANGELYDSLYGVEEVTQEATDGIDNYTRAAYAYVDLDTALSRIESEYSKVADAVEEFDSQGYISANTASTLINVNKDYADAITLVNGRLVINREQILALTEAERQNQIEMAKAAQANIENSIRETETTLRNIQTQIEAYKNLAASRKLATWEENVYNSYFESQRRLNAELADLEAQYDELGTEISILEAKNYDLAASNTAVANTASDIEDSYRWFIGKVTDILDDEIDALQDEKDYWNDYYDDKIAGIQDMIDALDQQQEEESKLLEIEEARAKLAKANQEVVRIFRRNQGFVFEKNMEAVVEAQDELNVLLKEWDQYQQRLELEQQVEDFENAKDATIEDIDEEIERLQDLKDQWSDALDIEDEVGEYSEWLDELEDFEKASYEERLDMLANFVASWNKKVSSMKAPSSGGGGGGGSNPNTGKDDKPTYGVNGEIAYGRPSDTGKGQSYGSEMSHMGRMASGSRSVPKTSVNLVGEEGPELRVLNRGDAMLKNSLTENLMEWGRFSPFSLLSKLPQFTQNEKTGNVFQFSFDNLTLPNVNNADTFVEELKTKSMRMAIQIQSQRA